MKLLGADILKMACLPIPTDNRHAEKQSPNDSGNFFARRSEEWRTAAPFDTLVFCPL